VMHRNGARVALGDRVLQSSRTEEENEQRQAERIAGAGNCQSTSLQARVPNVHWQSRIDAFNAPRPPR
jgi:hypothetical protein